jgi:hypothetical protein
MAINVPTPDPKLASKLPIKASYFVSNERSGLNEIKYENMLKEHQIILKRMMYNFIIKFNIEVRKCGYDIPYHQWSNYRITDYQIVKIQYHKLLNLYLYTFMVEVFRENKHYGFSIYLEMYFRAEKDRIWISKSSLMGIVPQDKLLFKQYGAYDKKKFNTNEIKEVDQSILDDLYTKMQNFDYRNQTNQSLSYNIEFRNHDLNAGHKCFKPDGLEYPDAQTSNACLSIDPNINKTGVWDKECKTNEECPFYKANKNYPNEFGKCIAGKCEMPVGMTRIGFKHYNKDKPLCYNCNIKEEVMTADGNLVIKDRQCVGIECNKCCDIQQNKHIYPNLKSPDFVFENDVVERLKYANELKLNGLEVNKILN